MPSSRRLGRELSEQLSDSAAEAHVLGEEPFDAVEVREACGAHLSNRAGKLCEVLAREGVTRRQV